MGIKAKQVAGVTTLVVVVVMAISAYHVATLVQFNVEETASRGQLLAQLIFQRAKEVVAQGLTDPYEALRTDGGIRSIIESSTANWPGINYVAIVNPDGVAVAHNYVSLEGTPVAKQEDFATLATAHSWSQLKAVYSDRTYEISLPIIDENKNNAGFGEIRVGLTTTLVRVDIKKALGATLVAILIALAAASLVAMLLSQWMLRPIHVIQSGLSRLGRGELDVTLDLKEEEFRDLGSSFDAISAQLSALGRGAKAEQPAGEAKPGSATDLESVMDNLEDAVALFSPRGELIFSNKSMDALQPRALESLPADSVVRQVVERTLAGRKAQGPVSIAGLDPGGRDRTPAHDPRDRRRRRPFPGRDAGGQKHRVLESGAIDAELLAQARGPGPPDGRSCARGEESAQRDDDSPRAAEAETRASAGSRRRRSRGSRLPASGYGFSSPPDVTKHVDIISKEIRRLDEVLNGFLKFARPDELKLQPVRLSSLISDIRHVGWA